MTTLPEPLESRIAPAALFFLSGTSLAVTNSRGISVNKSPVAAEFGAGAAVLLHPGDELILDVNGDHRFDHGDKVLVNVTAGSAIVFATHFEAGGAGFTGADISGLAVSNGFEGSVFTDVNGSVMTTLNGKDQVSPPGEFAGVDLLHASIDKLYVAGAVTESVVAGGDLSHVSIGRGIYSHPTGPVFLATGTGSILYPRYGNHRSERELRGYTISESLGGDQLGGFYFNSNPGEDGGDISHVRMETGAVLVAGAGGSNTHGNGGAGGSIRDVDINARGPIGIYAGYGGDAIGGNNSPGQHYGTGGNGGTVSNAVLHGTSSVSVYGGNGGYGFTAGPKTRKDVAAFPLHSVGGTGGSVGNIAVESASSDTYNSVFMCGGNGGASFERANGYENGGIAGRGGAIIHDSLNATGTFMAIDVAAGSGGEAFFGHAGAGGGVGFTSVVVVGNINTSDSISAGSFAVTAGAGGYGYEGTGANGGSIEHDSISAQIAISGTGVAVRGGNGGGGVYHRGAGGSIAGSMISFHGAIYAAGSGVAITGGKAYGLGCSGGSLENDSISLGGITSRNQVLVSGGNCGQPLGAEGRRQTGGSIENVGINVSGIASHSELEGLLIAGGNPITYGPGYQGGSISHLRLVNTGVVNGIAIRAGYQGVARYVSIRNDGIIAAPNLNGSLPNASLSLAARSATHIGLATSGTLSAYIAGNDISYVNIRDDSGGSTFHLEPAGIDSGYQGGIAGAISHVTFNAPLATVLIGRIGMSDAGGNGGAITDIRGVAGSLSICALGGGSDIGSSNAGGNGGSVENVSVTVLEGLQLLAAGNGGNGATPGLGGSIRNIFVNGDIGNFSGAFGTTGYASGAMGGIAAGVSGSGGSVLLNGSVQDVHATRIATIIAGQVTGSTVTASNAPSLISGVTATVIGADLNGNGVWDYVNNPASPTAGFAFGNGEQVIDGFVLGVDGRVRLGVTPLHLITVPA